MQSPTILVIDDDPYSVMGFFDEASDAGFKIMFKEVSDDIMTLLSNHRVAVVVIDIMMDPGSRYGAFESHGGFVTGQLLAREIRDQFPDQKIIAYSLHRDAAIQEWFNSQDGMVFVQKGAKDAAFMIKLLKRMISGEKEGWAVDGRELLDSIQLKPSFFGMGVDIKKALGSIKKK